MANKRQSAYLRLNAGTRISELSELVSRLFNRREGSDPVGAARRARLAEAILREIKSKGSIEAEKWKEYIEMFGATPAEYYAVLGRLKAAGFIRKGRGHHKGQWVLSREFSIMLRDFADYWEKWAFGGG